MFLHLFAILFTGGRVGVSATHPPLGRHPPARHPLGRHPRANAPGQTLPGRHCSPSLGRHPPGRTPPGQTSPRADAPPMLGYAQQVGGTHPTGMQFCILYRSKDNLFHLFESIDAGQNLRKICRIKYDTF